MSDREAPHEVIMIPEIWLGGFSVRGKKLSGTYTVAMDDVTDELISILRSWHGHRFAMVLRRIGDDERKSPANPHQTKKGDADAVDLISQPTLETPAEFGQTPPRATNFIKIGQMHRNHPPYQQCLYEYFRDKEDYDWLRSVAFKDPVQRRSVTGKIQHQYCKVDSLADIVPHTESALRFRLLETLFESDAKGLPPPVMEPNAFLIAGE